MDFNLKTLLEECIKANGSDLHIASDAPAYIRVDGTLRPLEKYGTLDHEKSMELCYEVLNAEKQSKLESELELDIAFTFEEKKRIRANIFWQQGTVAGAFRAIPLEIPTAEQLGLPPVIMELTKRPRGLLLVTGPTGSGKSTTLAAMINRINEEVHGHIVTIEDPVEYIHPHKNCLVNQREIGPDSLSFKNALKYILRQDPDVVLVGEMRDLETIQSAITVAETGHLVLATLHTNNAAQTIDRIIDVFPPHQQHQIKTQLSSILEGIISQQLVPVIGGGRTLALEIMIPHSGIRNMIREGKTHQLYSQMQVGQDETRMQTLNQSLAVLVKSGKISYDDGYYRSTDPEEFASLVGRKPKNK